MSVTPEAKRLAQDLLKTEYDVTMPNLLKRIREAANAETFYKTKCPNPRCGRDVQIQGIPDLRAATDAAKFLQAYAHGSPGKAPDPPSRVDMSRPLGEMSDEELTLLVASAGAVA